MKKNKILWISFLISTLVFIAVLAYFLLTNSSDVIILSVVLGFSIPSINYTLGMISIVIGLKKPDKSFLILVLGGMVFRLFLVLILIVLTLNFLNVRMNYFIFIIFIFYVYYLTVEILYLARKN